MATPIETLGDGRPLMLYQINQSAKSQIKIAQYLKVTTSWLQFPIYVTICLAGLNLILRIWRRFIVSILQYEEVIGIFNDPVTNH